ncbi:uncharacterized protein LOC114517546 [Dendronephthya gigantea]|uniref:uncharacterized protein LOC114517546 n=1 Tax=Dendronephthya gigantea TaxID=151771 RepID=UPI00106D6A49|nr:uncharacterized protein LOC114517546 [Dendronephthya gigantea]
MKLQTGVLLIWILCFVWSIKADSHLCGHRNISQSAAHRRVKRVIGGTEAKRNSWPWIVNFIDNQNLQQCAGSIIDHEWVLTAAHCFLFEPEPGPVKNYTYIVADHGLNKTDEHEYEITASKVYVHPKYFMGNMVSPGDYDIALMKLSKPLNYSDQVQPVCLGEKDDVFDENDTCVLTGWGNDKNISGYYRSPFLKEVKLDLVDLKVCNSNASYKGQVSDRFLCAGQKIGRIDGCSGDSGGPYQCERNNTWIQIGIMIWGIGCAEENHYGVYTDVRVLQSFIKAIQAGPNPNLTVYAMKSLKDVRPSLKSRLSSNLYDLFTNKGEFSKIDLVRNYRLVPYQIELINKTTLMDLVFVSSKSNVTANTTTLKHVITDIFDSQAKRLYNYHKSKGVVKEFNITFEEIYESVNLTKDGFLNSKSTVIEKVRKRIYVERYIDNLKMYRDTIMAYKSGLSVVFNISQFKKDLNKSADDLKNLEKKSLKLILVKHNQMLFTKMLGVRNISSFFETSLEILKNMTVAKVLTEYLHINLTTFASSHQLTSEEIDLLKLKKISSVSYPDDQSLYDLMKKILAELYDSCGIRYKHSRSRRKRVIGGREAAENSWPWIVNFINSNTREQYCAGSIIDRKWILTAGHCFVLSDGNLVLSNYTYHVGDHRLNFTDAHEYTIEASKLFIHPKYVGGADYSPGDNDIAMIELKRPLTYSKYVRPLCLVKDGEAFMNGTCYVSGWGNIVNKQGYHRSPVLKEAELDLVSLEACNSDTSYNGNISDSFICAGFEEGGTDSCSGDSGGPLQCHRNGSWVQIGIVSWGKQCALKNFYGVYSNVEQLLPFINAMKSGPNVNLTTYYEKTLVELLPKMHERRSKNLGELLTNNKQFSDFDLVRNLQSKPDQFKLLNKATLMNLVFVSDDQNLTQNNTMLKYIAKVFLQQTNRLKMYMKSEELGKELNITFDEMVQLLGLSKEKFLDSKPEVLKQVRSITLIQKLLSKLTGYKDDLMTYKNNVNISLDVMKIRQHFNTLSFKDINMLTEKELKQMLVNQNMILFTKTLSSRNISTFFNISTPTLRSMTVPDVVTQVLGISVHNFTSLLMLTAHQLEVIHDSEISTVSYSEEKTLYEITHALLEEKGKTNKCSKSRCAKNARCIQNSDYSFSCHCMKGYIKNGDECDTGNTIFESDVVLNQTFTESLNNPNSSEYLDLAKKIEQGLTAAIRKENIFPGFLGCQVTGFKKGSVVAQYILIFRLKETETVNASKLSEIIRRSVRNGSLALPVLSSKSLVATDFCSLGLHSCHEHATCTVRNDIVTCTCNKNYHGDGKSCVDPCKKLECPAHSYCFRGLNGHAKCICDSGYTYEEGECKDIKDLKPALIVVSCVAGTLLLLALLVCWYQYCNRNRNKSLEITANGDRGTENVAYDTMNMDKL